MHTGDHMPAAHARHGVRVRDDCQRQLRDIEELVARLQVVTKQLQFPAGAPKAATPDHGPVGAAPYDEAWRGERAEGGMN